MSNIIVLVFSHMVMILKMFSIEHIPLLSHWIPSISPGSVVTPYSLVLRNIVAGDPLIMSFFGIICRVLLVKSQSFTILDGLSRLSHFQWSNPINYQFLMAKTCLTLIKYRWLVLWNTFFFSHLYWNVIIPTDFRIFQRGRSTLIKYQLLMASTHYFHGSCWLELPVVLSCCRSSGRQGLHTQETATAARGAGLLKTDGTVGDGTGDFMA